MIADAAQPWLDFNGRVWVDDTEEAVAHGIASEEVVDRLAVVPRSARANTKWRWIVRGSVAALCALAMGLAISTKIALDNAQRARAELREAVATRLVIEAQQMLNGSRGGGDLRGILQVIAASRISSGQEATGALLDALLATRNVRKLLAVDVPVESLSVSPDGRRIASGHSDHTVRLWDTATGQPLVNPLKGHSKPVMIVAYSPDGRLRVSGTQDGTLQVWDAQTGEARGALVKAHDSTVTGLAFSADGSRIVSSGRYDGLRMWDSVTGHELELPMALDRENVPGPVPASVDDARRVVSVGDRTLYWERGLIKPTGASIEGMGATSAVAFSPDGRSTVAGKYDSTLQRWDSGSAMPRGAPLEGHRARVSSVAFSPDARWIASGSSDGTLRLWDAVTGHPLGGPLEGHRAEVSSVAFTPEGYVVSGSTTGLFALTYLMARMQALTEVNEPDTARIRIWMPPPGGSLSQVLMTQLTGVRPVVAFSPDGRRIATGGDTTLRLWDAVTGQSLGAALQGHRDDVTSIAFSSDGRLVASGSADHTIRIWDVETGREIRRLVGKGDTEVTTLAFSPDGQRLAAGSEIKGIKRNIRDTSPPRDDWDFRLWDSVTGTQLAISGADVDGVAFSPDNSWMVSGGSGLTLSDAKSGESLSTRLDSPPRSVTSVAISPDGRLIAAASRDQTLHIWDSLTGQAIGAPLRGHRGPVTTIAFSADGRQLVSGGEDKSIRVWDTQSGRRLGPALEEHTEPLTAVAFSPDGLSIVSAAGDQTVRRWPAPRAWANALCGKVTRNLSDREWREWVSPEIPYGCQCSGLPVPADDGYLERSRTCAVK